MNHKFQKISAGFKFINHKSLFIILFVFACFFTLAQSSQAADHYIRDGATGSAPCTAGWGDTQACDTLPSVLFRGDTYYIADGSYGSYTFDDAVSGTTFIYIKKATLSDHGTDTGWQDSYGDNAAIFTEWTFTTNYWYIDGQVGKWASDMPDYEAYGFRVSQAATSANAKLISFPSPGASYITLKYIEAYFSNTPRSGTWYKSMDIVYGYGSHWTFEYVWLHDAGRECILPVGADYMTISYSVLERNGQGQVAMGWNPSEHATIITFQPDADYAVIRYSYIRDWRSTGGLSLYSENTGMEFYGNVFTTTGYYSVPNEANDSNGVINGLSAGTNLDAVAYNNTFVDISYGCRIFTIGTSWVRRVLKNNLFYNCVMYASGANLAAEISGTRGSNWFYGSGTQSESNIQNGFGDPFVNRANKDYRLESATNSGETLSSTYNTDMFGNTRGSDGTWDRGAYEYGAGTSVTDPTPPTVSVTAPTSGSTVSDSITVLSNASDDVGVAGVQFKLDGANLGSEDTTSPYSISWNTATASTGSHTLTATARDTSGNFATSPAIAVTVSNPYTPPPLPPPPDGNLIAAYNFNEGSGTTLFDSSGNNNNGTLYGVAWTAAGKYAGALDFNGATSYIDIPNSTTLNITGNALTLEAWVNSDVLGTNMIASKPVSSSSHISPYFSYSLHTYPDGTPRFCITIGGTLSCVSSSQILTVNTWHHIAGVYDGNSLTIYVNGIVRGTFNISGSITGYTTPLRLGANGGFEENFDGRIDDIRIYNRALSASEIQTDMNTPVSVDTTPPAAPVGLTVN